MPFSFANQSVVISIQLSFLREAKWFCNKSTPAFEDYLENAWRSSSGPLLLVHYHVLLSKNTKRWAWKLRNTSGFGFIIIRFFTCLSSLLYILWDGCITSSERHQEKCIENIVSHINILVCVHRRIFREEKLQILYHATCTELACKFCMIMLYVHAQNWPFGGTCSWTCKEFDWWKQEEAKQRKTWWLFVSKTIYWNSF